MLAIRNLNVHYGGIHALRGIDIDVPDGKIIYAAWAVSADFKWTIPGERPYRLFDIMGNRLPLQDSRNLVLTERPVYVVVD